jgi:hypothetical protein
MDEERTKNNFAEIRYPILAKELSITLFELLKMVNFYGPCH